MQETATAIAEAPVQPVRLRGRIRKVVKPRGGKKGGYIFITAEDGSDWFAHMLNFERPGDGEKLFSTFCVGAFVLFTTALEPKPEINRAGQATRVMVIG